MTRVNSTTEAFTTALEKNKLTMGQYFRYAGGASKTFGRAFKSEFDTISKVAVERVKDLQTQYISMGRDANGALQSIKIRPLSLDMDNLATRTMVAAQKQQLFNQLLTQGSTNLLNFGKNTQWAGRQLMVGFTIPLTLFATSAAKSFMEIEKQVIRIRRVYGDFNTTVQETDDMINSIKSLAGEYTKYGIAVEKTIGLASEAAAAGKTGQELLAQVSQATRLAVLGNVEQSQALETTMSITNAFGTATEQLASKIDFLNAVENQSVTSIEDLTEAIPKAGPVVQQLGGDVEDLAFFLTAMKEGGINASEGANALKSGLAALINPTGKAKEMLQGFGINIEKIVESNKGDIKGLVIDFASALDTLDPLNRARAIEQLFGKFQFSRLSTLFQNVIGEGTQAARVLELTKATTQELAILSQRELKKVEDTTTYKFEKAFADFQAALAPVGEAFLKAVTPVIEFGTKLLNQFNSMGDGAKNFTVILTTVVAGIGPVLLMTVGLVANGVANLIKMFQLLGGIFKKTGVDTGILGVQTDYMTQQQIEAAAVAASLNQSHSKLTQTFSVEAAALNSLTAAYQRSITAQRGFGGGGSTTRSSTIPKKYAGGVVSVPGAKGAGDVVPAMLSPGEAVIPAAMAKKYGGLINGMVSGTIPGYENGLDPNAMVKGFPNATLFQPESMNTTMGRIGSKGVATSEVTAYLKQAGAAAAGSLMATMAKSMGLKLNDPTLKADFDNLGKVLITNATTALEKSGKQFVNDDDFEQIVVPALKNSAKGISVAGQEVSTALQKAITEIRTVSKIGIGGGTSGGAGRLSLPQSYRSDRIAGQKYAIATNPDMFRQAVIPSSTKGQRVSFQTLNPSLQKWETGTMAHIARSMNMSVQNLMTKVSPYLGDISGRLTKYLGDGVAKGMKDSTKTASPSKATTQIGADIGQGAINGINSKVDDAAKAGQNIGQAAVSGTQVAGDRRNRRVTKATGGQIVVVNQGGTQMLPGATRRQRRSSRPAPLNQNIFTPTSGISSVPYGPAPKKPGLGSRIAGGIRGTARAVGPMGGMMAMGAVGGGLSMIPGMEGLGAAVGIVGPLMMMLPGPIALAVGALGGFVGVLMSVNAAVEENRKKTIEAADANGINNKALKQLAIDIGKISPTESASKSREASLSGTTAAILSSGEQLLAESAGAQLILAGAEKQFTQNKDAEKAGKTLGQTLTSAVLEGLLSKEDATSLATAIGYKLGNINIAEIAAAQITGLTGNAATDIQSLLSSNTGTAARYDTLQTRATRYQPDSVGNENTLAINGFATDEINAYSLAIKAADIAIADANMSEQEREASLNLSLQKQNEAIASLTIYADKLTSTEFDKTIRTKVELEFPDDPAAQAALDLLEGTTVEDKQFKVMVQTQFAAGTITPSMVTYLINSSRDNKPLQETYRLILQTQGFNAGLSSIAIMKSQLMRLAQTASNVIQYIVSANSLTKATKAGGVSGIFPVSTALPPLFTPNDPVLDPPSGGDGGGGGTPEDSILKNLNEAKDKQQKALNVIALKEDAINKIYDKRKKALEDIAKLNQKIAENQKSQLTIAEALSSGDISAAARAVQDARTKASQYAEEQQMQALEKKRQMELDGIIVNGKTKEAYEAEIAKLNLQIAERELALANGAATSAGGGTGATGSRTNTGADAAAAAAAAAAAEAARKAIAKATFQKAIDTRSTNTVTAKQALSILTKADGGLIRMAAGGKVMSYFAGGGSLGSDTIPAMLTPGEFVVKRPAVQSFGVKNLEAINSGKTANGSVYNYSVTVNASTGANADEIARTVISRIKQVDGQKLRGNRY
jgi:TP901 family phage tail tape measure protein